MTRKKKTSYTAGVWAERFAGFVLICKGYRILARRYKTPVGEVDIVAKKRDVLVMVEVKLRQSQATALESVRPKARKRIERAALHYVATHDKYNGYDIRFDVISVVPRSISSGWIVPFSVHHLDNAWRPHT